jgi:DNA-directed RNA polymerase subunit RPC12/RpoP
VTERRHVVCPHCGKEFEGELLVSISAPGPRGFKCPHCRLFVPLERAASAGDECAEPAA